MRNNILLFYKQSQENVQLYDIDARNAFRIYQTNPNLPVTQQFIGEKYFEVTENTTLQTIQTISKIDARELYLRDLQSLIEVEQHITNELKDIEVLRINNVKNYQMHVTKTFQSIQKHSVPTISLKTCVDILCSTGVISLDLRYQIILKSINQIYNSQDKNCLKERLKKNLTLAYDFLNQDVTLPIVTLTEDQHILLGWKLELNNSNHILSNILYESKLIEFPVQSINNKSQTIDSISNTMNESLESWNSENIFDIQNCTESTASIEVSIILNETKHDSLENSNEVSVILDESTQGRVPVPSNIMVNTATPKLRNTATADEVQLAYQKAKYENAKQFLQSSTKFSKNQVYSSSNQGSTTTSTKRADEEWRQLRKQNEFENQRKKIYVENILKSYDVPSIIVKAPVAHTYATSIQNTPTTSPTIIQSILPALHSNDSTADHIIYDRNDLTSSSSFKALDNETNYTMPDAVLDVVPVAYSDGPDIVQSEGDNSPTLNADETLLETAIDKTKTIKQLLEEDTSLDEDIIVESPEDTPLDKIDLTQYNATTNATTGDSLMAGVESSFDLDTATKLNSDAWRQWGREINWVYVRNQGSDLYSQMQKRMAKSHQSISIKPNAVAPLSALKNLSPSAGSKPTIATSAYNYNYFGGKLLESSQLTLPMRSDSVSNDFQNITSTLFVQPMDTQEAQLINEAIALNNTDPTNYELKKAKKDSHNVKVLGEGLDGSNSNNITVTWTSPSLYTTGNPIQDQRLITYLVINNDGKEVNVMKDKSTLGYDDERKDVQERSEMKEKKLFRPIAPFNRLASSWFKSTEYNSSNE